MHLYGDFLWHTSPMPTYGASMGENCSFFTFFIDLQGMMPLGIAQ
jgi:hypothetical protein